MKRIILILLIILMICSSALADDFYVLCSTECNVRLHAKWTAEVIGHKYCGDVVHADGKRKNGFVHVNGLGFEYMDGWIYAGALVEDPPVIYERKAEVVSKGRVAARQYIGGKRNKWLKNGREVFVYAISEVWSITDQGYVQTKYLSISEIPQQEDRD